MTLAGLVAATLILLTVAAILIGTREGQPTLKRTRLAGWWAAWSLVAAVLTLAAGARRASGSGLRKLAARVRKLAGRIRAGRPATGPETVHGRHRKVATAR